MKEVGFQFTVEHPGIDESFPPDMPLEKVASFLAGKKASVFVDRLHDEIVVTADTVVILDKNDPQQTVEQTRCRQYAHRLERQDPYRHHRRLPDEQK